MTKTLAPDGALCAHRFGAALTSSSLVAAFAFGVEEHIGVFAAAPR